MGISNVRQHKNDENLDEILETIARTAERLLADETGYDSWVIAIHAGRPRSDGSVFAATVLPGEIGLDILQAVLESQGYIVKSPDDIRKLKDSIESIFHTHQ